MKAIIKENISIKGQAIRCGSKMLENYIAPYDAAVIEKLRDNNVDIIGTSNMDEFAMGSTTETSFYGVTENPLDSGYVAGGSSGGSAAAVAKGECDFALGSDTGGSIRLPASYCGVVGLKPTYGTVSRYGLTAYASSMDVIGPIAKDVESAAICYDMIKGKDSRDSSSVPCKDISIADYIKSSSDNIGKLKIGVPYQWLDGAEPYIRDAVTKAVDTLESLGMSVNECNIKYADYVAMTYYVIACAEASSNLARYDGVKYGFRADAYEGLHDMYKHSRSEGFGKETKKRIMLGTYVLSEGFIKEYFLQAAKVRRLITNEFIELFKKYDCILMPTAPTTAPKIGELINNPIRMYKSDLFTAPANLTGMPALSLPSGQYKDKLPIGIQLMGTYFSEDIIMRIAYLYEKKLNQ